MDGRHIPATQLAPEGEQFLTFRLGGLDYAIPILDVQEIRKWSAPTPMPHSPPYVEGILNLRGAILPVIDLRRRFALPAREVDPFTVIVIVNVADRLAGLIVDAVNEVATVPETARRQAPEYEGGAERDFIKGFAEVHDRLLVLLDLQKLVRPETLAVPADVPAEDIRTRA